jgi:hypothetical protein
MLNVLARRRDNDALLICTMSSSGRARRRHRERHLPTELPPHLAVQHGRAPVDDDNTARRHDHLLEGL